MVAKNLYCAECHIILKYKLVFLQSSDFHARMKELQEGDGAQTTRQSLKTLHSLAGQCW